MVSLRVLRKIERILKGQSLRNFLLFVIGTNCGLRISDILSLNVEDVKGKSEIRLVEQKTGKKKQFPINSKLAPLLTKFTKGRCGDEPLFLGKNYERLGRAGAYKIIKTACEMADAEINAGTHTMRKTFGYFHYKKYKDVVLLQKILNHSSPYITLSYIGIDQTQIDQSYRNFVL